MSVQAFVNFNGNCREAVKFYAEAFGVEEPKIMTFGEMPPDADFPLDDYTRELVMYTDLKIFGGIVMFSDALPGRDATIGDNISLVLTGTDEEALTRAFNNLKVGGKVEMDLQETFWSKVYGYLVDKYGVGWQVSLAEEK
ncbi:VOC family protein [Anaerotalea alkaliphila]|uniref:VOC family protein n=1 Tax=Anaerotalea alkaliphila TaxID=2662126 RepID=A0A7X5HV62_9FIRM|nr:VOC family protein [Anaerotalea alkaliphila]NDL67242.1 VOC family protein [Anaerotalea alkaliphila]